MWILFCILRPRNDQRIQNDSEALPVFMYRSCRNMSLISDEYDYFGRGKRVWNHEISTIVMNTRSVGKYYFGHLENVLLMCGEYCLLT